MKKSLLSLALAIATGIGCGAFAESATYTYTYTDADGFTGPVYGSVRRVSPSGRWACGGDEVEETGAFVIDTSSPDKIVHTADGYLLDIDDNGLAVGAWYERDGYAKYKRAAIFKDGRWERLPLPKEIIGLSFAVAISADSRIIAGHAMCASEDAEETGVVGGKYFPLTWELNDATGEYEVKKLYNGLYLPGTFGFFVYDMTPDAKVICGMQCLDMGDNIAAMLDTETGELTIWHEIEYREVGVLYGDQWLYSDDMFVDGILDGGEHNQCFNGMFLYATDRYLFGCHDVVSDVDEYGNGIVTTYSTAYDLETREFIDSSEHCVNLCGVSPDETFTNLGTVMTPGDEMGVSQYLAEKFDINGGHIDGIYCLDEARKVLGGASVLVTEIGDMVETPVLVMLDAPVFTGIRDVKVESAHNVRLDGRRITVEGADNVAVYSASGMAVGTGASVSVAPGIYVVQADGKTYKVLVK